MATSDSREVVIEATPEEILDVIADVEATPDVVAAVPEGRDPRELPRRRPKQVKMTVKAAGLTDVQVIEYTWADDRWSWTLVSAGQLKAQDAATRSHRTATRPRSGST